MLTCGVIMCALSHDGPHSSSTFHTITRTWMRSSHHRRSEDHIVSTNRIGERGNPRRTLGLALKSVHKHQPNQHLIWIFTAVFPRAYQLYDWTNTEHLSAHSDFPNHANICAKDKQ